MGKNKMARTSIKGALFFKVFFFIRFTSFFVCDNIIASIVSKKLHHLACMEENHINYVQTLRR